MRYLFMLLISLISTIAFASAAKQSTPLPSWNDVASKQAIVKFVESVTDVNSRHFVPKEERIAVFDNDGTLWSEKPFYFQLFFAIDQLKSLSPEHPEWQEDPMYKAVKDNNLKALAEGGHDGLLKLMMLTHANTSTEEFSQIVKDWIKTARHPETNKLFTDMVFQPMLELLNYLRTNDFKTYIVSGGGLEFMRPWSEEVYGIPPEQVIGSNLKTKFKLINGQPKIVRLAEINTINDKEVKPTSIWQHIGKKPIAAFGNSDGDLQMLQWTTAGSGQSFGLIVHHTDAEREWLYDKDSLVGHLEKALFEAQQNNWTVVDMKMDWKTVFKN